MLPTQTIIDQINSQHTKAMTLAEDAIKSAIAVGECLIEVKAALPHGTLAKWLKSNTTISLRQAQRYMARAKGKPTPPRKLIGKNDTVSHLQNQARSKGIWKNGKWEPEAGCMYLFNEDGSTYWVLPSIEHEKWFHVSKLYDGPRMSTDGFYKHYTIFSVVDDPDLTSKFYVGTTTPLGWSGVGDVLKTYGLKDFDKSLIRGKPSQHRYERPFGEQPPENWYWGINGQSDDREAYADSMIESMSSKN